MHASTTSTPPSTYWNKTYGGAADDEAANVIQTSDGGYAIIGSENSFGAGGYDGWLVKTDSAGVMQWNQTYGGTGSDAGFSVVQTSNGEYVLAGTTTSFGAGNSDYYLVGLTSGESPPSASNITVYIVAIVVIIVIAISAVALILRKRK